jgi:VWFA-related protein
LVRSAFATLLAAVFCATTLSAQTSQPTPTEPEATLQINSRAVLVDVLVTDQNGRQVHGLKSDAFRLEERGKPQTIAFFEEHTNAQPGVPRGPQGQPMSMPALPQNEYSNFSPFPEPPAVTVLLLDTLNTPLDGQNFVHKQALKFFKSEMPGTRMAIFAMGYRLSYIQGFTDDPRVLLSALTHKTNNGVGPPAIDVGGEQAGDIAMMPGIMKVSEIAAASGGSIPIGPSNLNGEYSASRTTDRALLTLQNLGRLANLLSGIPGRKNVIWFSEAFPLINRGSIDPVRSDALDQTMAELAAARVAIYPVDTRGTDPPEFYQASNNFRPVAQSDIMGNTGAQVLSLLGEDRYRAAARYTEETMADETGGKAFAGSNNIAGIIGAIASATADFYTLSYVPTNQQMDGRYRKIEVKVAGGRYSLSYRRGYSAIDAALPGSAMPVRAGRMHKLAAQNPGAVDPLSPFMDLGMPQTQQIVFRATVKPAAETPAANSGQATAPSATPPANPDRPTYPIVPKGSQSYMVNLAVDLSGLALSQDAAGSRNGALRLSLLTYDRYGNIVKRNDTQATLGIKPDVWEIYQKTGLPFNTEVQVPRGPYRLRIGIYDQGSGKVGTLEIPLDSVTVAQKTL